MKQPPSKRVPALVLFVLAVSLWTGCGGGLSTSSMSQAEFTGRAETICAHGRLRSLRFHPPPHGLPERARLTEAIDSTLLPAIQGVVDEIYALGAPAERKARTEAFLTAMQEGIDEAEELDAPTVEGVEKLLARSGQLAQKDGLESCAYG